MDVDVLRVGAEIQVREVKRIMIDLLPVILGAEVGAPSAHPPLEAAE
ncbi:hypothetical protein [Methylobacterium sp. PvR107]|nr:hypothetical protein [Methylobacterium sp. PvR107]MBP1181623.1 hypothetical protein [Methylobacterium sp. PvR107]